MEHLLHPGDPRMDVVDLERRGPLGLLLPGRPIPLLLVGRGGVLPLGPELLAPLQDVGVQRIAGGGEREREEPRRHEADNCLVGQQRALLLV